MNPARYYAYSPTLGRRLLTLPNGDHVTNGAEATRMAQRLHADNLVREEGPVSKPLSVRIVWTKENAAVTPDAALTAHVQAVLSRHFPNATVQQIGDAARDIARDLTNVSAS